MLALIDTMNEIKNFDDLASLLIASKEKVRVAIACPEDEHIEYVVSRALNEGIADFILIYVGKLKVEFEKLRLQYPQCVKIFEVIDQDSAAQKAVELVRNGDADVLMKGTMNTDNLLKAVLDKEKGLLETGRILTHIALCQIPSYKKFIVFSDAAVIPYPSFEKFDAILQYTIKVCHSLGILCPNVALIHCTEKVSQKFPNTIDYLQLIKKAEQGIYGKACVAGPMDVKTACDKESGKLKGISSQVVGQADVLIFPDIQAGNVFYKTITLFGKAKMAGILVGTSAPIVVTSRADSSESKYYSLALACFLKHCKF